MNVIESGKTVLGIELGSTRIKAVLIDENHKPIASGSHDWENKLVDNIWTYSLEDIWAGVQDSYTKMAAEVKEKYGTELTKIGAIGFSAMMHGYMSFNKSGELLVPFRTWRNSITEEASEKLTELFNYNIPQRWSIAHLYQAILNKEEHVNDISFITTLAGYIHWKLTGKKVIGVGEASGMFPIDINTKQFDKTMTDKFNSLLSTPWELQDIMPEVLLAGEDAGELTEEGARLLDVSGKLQSGIPLCPPEGDAGTGMVATNSVEKRTGNVSAGTSVFAMIVLEKELSRVYPEIDLVTTPMGDLVAMVHANNCTSDINSWVNMFKEFAEAIGCDISTPKLFDTLYVKSLEGDADCGGLMSYGYLSGENITHMESGCPLFVNPVNANMNLANFIRTHLFSAMGALKIGMDILMKQEGVKLDKILGHGGLFKTEKVGQSYMAAAINAPVTVMETAGEGGAWGIALLAAYMINKKNGETLAQYLDDNVFSDMPGITIAPDEKDADGFNKFIERYKNGLTIERAAIDSGI